MAAEQGSGGRLDRDAQQFGHEYSDTAHGRKNFRKEFEAGLADVLKLYPGAKIEPSIRGGENAGKILRLSPPPVAEKGQGQAELATSAD